MLVKKAVCIFAIIGALLVLVSVNDIGTPGMVQKPVELFDAATSSMEVGIDVSPLSQNSELKDTSADWYEVVGVVDGDTIDVRIAGEVK